jgi:hypothetical protein
LGEVESPDGLNAYGVGVVSCQEKKQRGHFPIAGIKKEERQMKTSLTKPAAFRIALSVCFVAVFSLTALTMPTPYDGAGSCTVDTAL